MKEEKEHDYPDAKPPLPEEAWLSGFMDTYDVIQATEHIMKHYKISRYKLRCRMGWTKEYIDGALDGSSRKKSIEMFIRICKELNHSVIFAVYPRRKLKKILPWQKKQKNAGMQISESNQPKMGLY